jgi:hypothetical protein
MNLTSLQLQNITEADLALIVKSTQSFLEKKCSVENCKSFHKVNGYCRKHNKQLFVNAKVLVKKSICSVEKCTSKLYAKGCCRTHYEKFRKVQALTKI